MAHKILKEIETLLKQKSGIKLDIGCGDAKQPGWVGMDYRKLKGVDIVHDLEVTPWPLPNECASFAMASHVIEHINPHGGVFLRFMDEVWRVLQPEAQFIAAMPYAGSPGYWQDPTHCNGCNEHTWAYFDPLLPTGSLWYIYRPKPWKVVSLQYNPVGNMEVVLEKRLEDKSYKSEEAYNV